MAQQNNKSAGKKAAAAPDAAPSVAEAVVDAPAASRAAKVKRVRDTFTMPKDEYAVIGLLKVRAARLGRTAKKSELLRAGLRLLVAAGDEALLRALQALPPSKAAASPAAAVKRPAPKAKAEGAPTSSA